MIDLSPEQSSLSSLGNSVVLFLYRCRSFCSHRDLDDADPTCSLCPCHGNHEGGHGGTDHLIKWNGTEIECISKSYYRQL